MRRILILLAIVALIAAALLALWIFGGREISSFVDRYWTAESRSVPIQSIAYEGSGTGGILIVNAVSLSLNDLRQGLSLSVGTTKDNELALATRGKVFPFGPLKAGSGDSSERLIAVPPQDDQAFLAARHSVLSWPTPFDLNFITGRAPSWKRHFYQEIRWRKTSGANLKMLWRYEQVFYPGNGWTRGSMTAQGSTGLIRVEIKD